jgi:hypothetical protein
MVLLLPSGDRLPIGSDHRRIVFSWDQPLTRAQARQLARRLRHITVLETQRGGEPRTGGSATPPRRGRPVPSSSEAPLHRLRRMLGI